MYSKVPYCDLGYSFPLVNIVDFSKTVWHYIVSLASIVICFVKRYDLAKNGRRSLLRKSERRKPTKMKENIKKFVNNHYIESVFLVHHYYDKNPTFNVLILPMASKKIRTSKIKNINYLWRITYGYQGLWGVRLGSIRLG